MYIKGLTQVRSRIPVVSAGSVSSVKPVLMSIKEHTQIGHGGERTFLV
ncbi:hypothetical protein AB205_0000730 [Aquarana catesbeiana]|uniref:Uncharacterized protein n=1 Tax=Aquarana catesbeiana TaxID=8400 RepID=A0A2G9QCI7_AQUCT|nr:hypothetical protein AB205_0000730 [Aquarana catesbeiana]